MRTISFYSYKGGVGRTLTVANLSMYLAQFGARVVTLDFDLEAPGLHYKYGLSTEALPAGMGGITGLMAHVSKGGEFDGSLTDLVVDVTQQMSALDSSGSPNPSNRIRLIPAGDPTKPRYWSDLANIDWKYLFSSRTAPGATALRQLKRRVNEEYEPDFFLIDSRTGITESSGVATTLLSDLMVTLLLNTPEHVDGTMVVLEGILRSRPQNFRIVPVLARFSLPHAQSSTELTSQRRPIRLADRRAVEREATQQVVLNLTARIRDGLPSELSKSVDPLFLLHSDTQLLTQERLQFGAGKYASVDAAGDLLEDYLRLFAHLVPRESIEKYVQGVRMNVRDILLDRPADALVTLETLASLVADEKVFEDLVKLYGIQSDYSNILKVCQRAFRINGLLIRHPVVTQALDTVLSARFGPAFARSRTSGVELGLDFVLEYWHSIEESSPPALAISVANFVIGLGDTSSGRKILEAAYEGSDHSVNILASMIHTLCAGNPLQEAEAARLAVRYFKHGEGSSDFLASAVQAMRYTDDGELVKLLSSDDVLTAIPLTDRVEVLRRANRMQEAARLGLQVLLSLDEGDLADPDESREIKTLVLSTAETRNELQAQRPDVFERLMRGRY